LTTLPADDRIAFALRVMEGMELLEVAEACRVSLATAKRRIARAQRRFAELVARDPWLREHAPRGRS
jgi:RNA polymerase sigma-70 factor (ECF subfamily)